MKRPKWNEWKHTPSVTVWQACAVSMDIDPHSMVWRSTGRYALPFVKIGRNVRYRRADLIAWLGKRTRETGATG